MIISIAFLGYLFMPPMALGVQPAGIKAENGLDIDFIKKLYSEGEL